MARDLRTALVVTTLLTALAAVAGCAPPPPARVAGRPSPSPRASSAVTTPARVPLALTWRDLAAALPDDGSLTGWHGVTRCVRRGDACARLRTRHGTGHGVFVSATGSSDPGGPVELLLLSVVRWPTPAAARGQLTDVRQRSTVDFSGRFDHPVQWTSGTEYHPGEVGHGSVRDLTHGAWRGFERDAVLRYVQPASTTKRIRVIYLSLRRGRYTVQAQVGRWLDRPARLRARPVLDDLLGILLGRLDAG